MKTTLELFALADSLKNEGHTREHVESAAINRDSAWRLINGMTCKHLSAKERERCARRRLLDAIDYSVGCLDSRYIEAKQAVEEFERNVS